MSFIELSRSSATAEGIRFSLSDGTREIGRAYLYIMHNDLHAAPFGLLEDVYIEETKRGSGLGTRLVQDVIAAAKNAGCYKLVATSRLSRPKVHELYRRLGFHEHGVEFRIELG